MQESLDKDVLDYGHLSESDVGSKNFTIENYNPIRVSFLRVGVYSMYVRMYVHICTYVAFD